MRVAISGSRRVPVAVRPVVTRLIESVPEPDEWTTGGAYGIDTLAAECGKHTWPRAWHRLVYPQGERWNEGLLADDIFDELVPVVGGYLKRDEALVTYGDVLIAFPSTTKWQPRSGTWATIRRANLIDIPICIIPLDTIADASECAITDCLESHRNPLFDGQTHDKPM